MTAKEFEKKYGFGYSNRKSIWIGEFCFFAYVDYHSNGTGRMMLNLDSTSVDLVSNLDFKKEYNTTESLKKDLRRQMEQLAKRINKALLEPENEWNCFF